MSHVGHCWHVQLEFSRDFKLFCGYISCPMLMSQSAFCRPPTAVSTTSQPACAANTRSSSHACRRLLCRRGSAGVTRFFAVFLNKFCGRTTCAMQALKKAAKAVGSNKVHPTESQDADSETAQPPRRSRQSRDMSVAGNDSIMPPSILKIGSSKHSPEVSALRRPSFS